MPISLTTGSANLICICTQYIEQKNGSIRIIKDVSDLKHWKSLGYKTAEEAPNNVKQILSITSYWKPLIWKEYMDLLGQSVRYKPDIDGKPTQFIDAFVLTQNKLYTCLKKWDLKDENNNEIQVTPETIDRLPAAIANEMLAHFEDVSELSSDDMKHIEEASAHFFKGQGDKAKIPDYESILPFIYEHIIARTYKISPYDVRQMSHYDFNIHLRLCIQHEYAEKEFKANLAGAKSGKTPTKSETPQKGGGTKKVFNSTKLIKFNDGRRTTS